MVKRALTKAIMVSVMPTLVTPAPLAGIGAVELAAGLSLGAVEVSELAGVEEADWEEASVEEAVTEPDPEVSTAEDEMLPVTAGVV